MNTTLLRYAVEYAACGSAQKTAERLGVSRSSVARNIKRLESELGAQLFVNSTNGVIPTLSGDICLRYAKEILRTEEDLRFDFAGNGVYSGSVDVGMGPTRSHQILPAVLTEFHRHYPNISVQLHELSTMDSIFALLNQRVDFAVISQPPAGQNISFEPLLTEQLVLVAPKADPFVQRFSYWDGGKAYVLLEHFRDRPFILGYPDQKSRMACVPLFRKLNYEPRIIFQTRNSYTAATLAYNGLAYALVPESCTSGEAQAIPYYHMTPDLSASWTIGIAALGNSRLSLAAEQLKLLMLKTLGEKASPKAPGPP